MNNKNTVLVAALAEIAFVASEVVNAPVLARHNQIERLKRVLDAYGVTINPDHQGMGHPILEVKGPPLLGFPAALVMERSREDCFIGAVFGAEAPFVAIGAYIPGESS